MLYHKKTVPEKKSVLNIIFVMISGAATVKRKKDVSTLYIIFI